MQVCQHCGEPVLPHQTFCKNCGTKIEAAPSQNLSPIPEESQTRSNIQQKNAAISAPIKWTIAAVVVLAAVLFGVHTYLSNLYKPEKTVAMFEQAVKQKDYNTLRKILTQDGAPIDASDSDLAAYANFLTKDMDLSQIVSGLNKNAAGMKYYQKITPVTDSNNNNLLELEKGPKLLGIYQKYVINVYPFTIKAQTNADNTDIYINGQKAKRITNSNNAATIGKYLPGDYTLKAVYKGDYVSLNSQAKVDFSNSENNAVTTDVNLNGHFISVYSNGDGAEIYANGKDTGKKVGIDSFGPVPINGSVELYAVLNRDSGPIKSAAVKITGDGEVFLNFQQIANAQQQAQVQQAAQDALNIYGSSYDSPQQKMQTFMDEFVNSSVNAINSRDFSEVESYLSPNGKEYLEEKNYIDYLATKNITEGLINLTVTNVANTNNGFKVTTNEQYYIYYGDGSEKQKTFESNYTLTGDSSGLKVLTLDSAKEISSTDM